MSTAVTINDVIPRTQAIATNLQTVFNTNWTADVAANVNVYARATGVDADDATQLVSSSDYNVTFIGGSETVRVTFLAGRTTGDIITIVRNTPADRQNLYTNTNFTPSMLNDDFGILDLVDQQAQLFDEELAPHYNKSCTFTDESDKAIDNILPILGANQIWAKNNANDAMIAYDVPSSGTLAPGDATYLLQTANADLPNAQAMGSLASGIVVNTLTTGVQLTRVLTGTTDQITVGNGSGISGAPTFSISDNPILPGTGSFIPPKGTTAQRPGSPVAGMVRYNTTFNSLEVYQTSWDLLSGGLVDTITGTANQITVDNTDPANPILAIAANVILPGTGGETLPSGTTAQRAGTAGTMRFNSQTSEFEGTTDGIAWNTFQTSAGTVLSVLGTANRITSSGGANPVIDIAATYVGQASITTLGTIATGTWQGTVIGGTYGGTGVNNGASTITLGGSLSTIGAFTAAFTMTGNTAVTFPTSGTLLTSAGAVTSIIATANQTTVSGATGDVTIGLASNPVIPGTAGVTLSKGTVAQRAGAAGTMRFNTDASVFEGTLDGATWVTLDTHTAGDVDSIIGTANQIIASSPTGNVTLSLPQSIATTSSPTFAALTLTAPLTVANGGSGRASTTAYAVICGGTTSTSAEQSIASVGTAGQILTSNGAGALPTFQAAAAGVGGLRSFQVFTSGTAATYTRPAGITSILVECVGGGGGGGGVDAVASSVAAGGGGAGGSYCRKWYLSAAATYTYTVGGGGAGGTAGANNGSTGTATTFDTMSATGGGGGVGILAQNGAGVFAAGGVAAVSTGGDLNTTGFNGASGTAGLINTVSGHGGNSIFGGGAASISNSTLTTSTAGGNATAYGGGGSGAVSFTGTTDRAGGNGSAGVITVWEFA